MNLLKHRRNKVLSRGVVEKTDRDPDKGKGGRIRKGDES
jgi:hypothetical protein